MREAELFEKLESASVDDLWTCLAHAGVFGTYMTGLQAVCPGSKMVGRAITMRCTPYRPDLEKSLHLEERGLELHMGAIRATPGDVLVVDVGGTVTSGIVGDIVVEGFRKNGGAGIVAYGGIRDMPAIRKIGLPVYCTGAHAGEARDVMCVEFNGPVRCAGVTVAPGDILLGDDESVIVIPPHVAEEVAEAALAIQLKEAFIRENIRSGRRKLQEAYPMNAEVQAEYEAFKKGRAH